MSEGTFDLNAFIQESKETLLNPKSYFSTMKTSGGMTEPLIKAVIYGAVAGAIAFLWSILKLGAVTGGILGGSIGIMVFISYIIGSIIGLFIGAVILMVISSICKGSTDFETNVRVIAALMVVMPIAAALAFTGHLSLYLGMLVGLAVNIYSLWLLYNALIETLKAKPETTKIVMYILIAIFVLFSLVGLGAKRRANDFMKEFNSSDMKEMIEQQK
jgi:hypothetical protein